MKGVHNLNKYIRYIKKILLLMQLHLRLQISKSESGFIGIILEPFLLVVAIYLIKRFFLRSVLYTYGLSTFVFIVCGVLPFYAFTRISYMGLKFPDKYQNKLINLPYIQEFDLFISAGLNQIRTVLITFFIFLYIEFVRVDLIMQNIFSGVFVLILVSLIGVGFAVNLNFFVKRIPLIRMPAKIIIRRVLFWTSGLFYSLNSLPLGVRKYIGINPIIHASELLRGSITEAYPVNNASIGYLISWASALLGLAMVQSLVYQSKNSTVRDTKKI